MKDYLLSIILYIDDADRFSECMAYYNRSERKEDIQLIVMNPNPESQSVSGSFDGSAFACFSVPEMPIAEAYQFGLEYAEGKYVNFALSSSYFSPNAYTEIMEAFDKYHVKMVSAAPFWISDDGEAPYCGAYISSRHENLIRLTEQGQEHHIQLLLQAYFFLREAVHEMAFSKNMREDALFHFLLSIQLKYPEYVLLSDVKYYYTEPLEDNYSLNHMQYDPYWYCGSLREFIIPFMQSTQKEYTDIPAFLQVACYYLIYTKFYCNIDDRNKRVLRTKEEVQQFYNIVFQAFVYIDNDIIMEQRITSGMKALRSMCITLLRGKAMLLGEKVKIIDLYDQYFAILESSEGSIGNIDDNYKNHVCRLGASTEELLRISNINYINGTILIDAVTNLAHFFSPEEIKIFAARKKDDVRVEIYQPEYTQIYPLTQCFGVTYMRKLSLQFRIPIKGADRHTFSFYFKFAGKEHMFYLSFSSFQSRIYAGAAEPYWKFRKGWMLRTNTDKNEIIIEQCGLVLQIKKEIKFCQSMFKNKECKDIRRRGISLRILYWIMQPFFRHRHIWVTFDKIYKAGDNGEYMFQYIRENCKDIDMYYVIRKDSPDYNRLVKQHNKHILEYGSLRCQLIFLNAEIILATHVNISAQFNPLPLYREFTKDLMKGEVICIQHGLTVQKIAQYQNRVHDNTKLYCCASPYEVENLSHPFYGYSREQLKITGLARYDGLKNTDQKIILIAPTWRRDIVNFGVANIKKTYNDQFKESDYFKIYNRLINDKQMIDCAKTNGYRVVFLLHPAISSQIDDFTPNDDVKLVKGSDTDYEEILCASSLMVTDYSGVQFDFAYMRKPLIYYHPDEIPPHYDEGGFVYHTMGFGPVCKTHTEVVNQICRAIERGCQTEKKYEKREEDFYTYNDSNNCKRILEAVKEYQNSKGKDISA